MTSVTELIGNDYLNWRPGDIITISTATGSGKTTFVLYQLLYYAICTGRVILYLVNRKVLKEQIEWRINTEVKSYWASMYPFLSLNSFLKVYTYQEIEEYLKSGNENNLDRMLTECGFVVYDECHYFVVDSVFNPATDLSWSYLTHKFGSMIQVFMSATINSMKRDIEQLINRSKIDCNDIAFRHRMTQDCVYNYPEDGKNITSDEYDYVDLYDIDSEDELPVLIKNGDRKAKWLIFVDSISKGRKLFSKLRKIEGDNNLIFIYAKYKNDLDAYERVLELKLTASISKRIVIATSVMDNGISFRDRELQNVVIFADMQEPFIQMLGRKRKDRNRVNVYICKRSESYFSTRVRNIDETLQYLGRYDQEIMNIRTISYPKEDKNETQKNHTKESEEEKTNQINEMVTFGQESQKPLQGKDQALPKIEFRAERQQAVLNDLLNNEEVRKNLKRFCYICCGTIRISPFSNKRLADMRNFYVSMMDKLKTDKNAFLYEQAKWLGFDENRIMRAFSNAQTKKNQLVFSSLRDVIEKNYLNKLMTTSEKADLSHEIREYLRMLLVPENTFNAEEIEHLKSSIKSDRAISVDTFNRIMSKFPWDLPYEMKRSGKSNFIIEKA